MQRLGLWSVLALAIVACGMTAKLAYAAGGDMLQPGATAPGFTLPSQEDKAVNLADYKGKWIVLYFYPKDKTAGCTLEAHNFQRDLAKYTAANAVILGVSLDTTDSHKSFCTQESLTFKLLADPEHKVVDSYGVPVKGMGPIKFASRVTYLIAPDGKIAKVWPAVQVPNHSDEVLTAINEMKK